MRPCSVNRQDTASLREGDNLVPSRLHPSEARTPEPTEIDHFLRGLYIATTFSCLTMVVWIMVAPGSWLIGRSSFHREVLIPHLEQRNVFVVVPVSLVTKYQGHDLVHFTHLIPGAIWAAIVPFQLHPTWRNNHRKLHRLLGYLFLGSSFLVAIGVFVMLQRKLTYENYFPDLEPSTFHDLQRPALGAVSLWFAFTAIQSVRMARAKNFAMHQKWMYRHVASGIWVAVQRYFVLSAMIYVHLTFDPSRKPSQWAQREFFALTANWALVLCILVGEYAQKRVPHLTRNKKIV